MIEDRVEVVVVVVSVVEGLEVVLGEVVAVDMLDVSSDDEGTICEFADTTLSNVEGPAVICDMREA